MNNILRTVKPVGPLQLSQLNLRTARRQLTVARQQNDRLKKEAAEQRAARSVVRWAKRFIHFKSTWNEAQLRRAVRNWERRKS